MPKPAPPVEESATRPAPEPVQPVPETVQPEPTQPVPEPVQPVPEPEPTQPVPTSYRISAIPATGFCRAGRRWYREGQAVDRADFTAEQWDALVGEPLLIVTAL